MAEAAPSAPVPPHPPHGEYGGTAAGEPLRSTLRYLGATLVLPAVEPMTSGTFATAQCDTSQPKDEKDHGQDPQKMHCYPNPGKYQDQ